MFTSGYSGGEGESAYTNTASLSTWFSSDDDTYAVGLVNGEAVLGVPYNVTTSTGLTGGTVTANKTSAAAGETVTLTGTPAAGYVLNTLTVTQGETVVTLNTDNTFTMPAGDVTVTAVFVPVFGPATFTLPAAVRTVEESAFEGSTAIGVVYVPDTCTAIGADAFKNCTGLTQIRLPKNCTIGDGAFDGCTGLIAVYAPAGGTTEAWCTQANIPFIWE